jgi:hypothetical protein
MRNNRLAPLSSHHSLPQPAAPAFTSGSYVGCPLTLMQGLPPQQLAWQWLVYLIAFQQAQIETRPSLLERDLLGVWN